MCKSRGWGLKRPCKGEDRNPEGSLVGSFPAINSTYKCSQTKVFGGCTHSKPFSHTGLKAAGSMFSLGRLLRGYIMLFCRVPLFL